MLNISEEVFKRYGRVYEPAVYIRRALKMFEAVRKELGDEVELKLA